MDRQPSTRQTECIIGLRQIVHIIVSLGVVGHGWDVIGEYYKSYYDWSRTKGKVECLKWGSSQYSLSTWHQCFEDIKKSILAANWSELDRQLGIIFRTFLYIPYSWWSDLNWSYHTSGTANHITQNALCNLCSSSADFQPMWIWSISIWVWFSFEYRLTVYCVHIHHTSVGHFTSRPKATPCHR